jgi:hypothetical protein
VSDRSRIGLRGALLLFALLGGLFAMHGLADHGTTHGGRAGDHAGSRHIGAGVGEATAELAAAGRGGGGGGKTTANLATPPPGAGHQGHPEGAICLGLLVAGLALLFARFRRTLSCREAATELLVARAWSPIRARAPDPPDLTRLGICRC